MRQLLTADRGKGLSIFGSVARVGGQPGKLQLLAPNFHP